VYSAQTSCSTGSWPNRSASSTRTSANVTKRRNSFAVTSGRAPAS
jgi:hypothetical protein